ncbi:MAG: hypothetical protein ACETVT_02100 [bacterium]
MAESEEHEKLRLAAKSILEKHNWHVEDAHEKPTIGGVDLTAVKEAKLWKIEIEISCSNISTDLDNGAEIFVTTPKIKPLIEVELALLYKKVPVCDIDEFEKIVKLRSALKY